MSKYCFPVKIVLCYSIYIIFNKWIVVFSKTINVVFFKDKSRTNFKGFYKTCDRNATIKNKSLNY